MNKIKQYIWEKKIDAAKDSRDFRVLAKKLSESKKIGVVFQEGGSYDSKTLESLSDKLRKQGANVKFIGIQNAEQTNIACPYPLVSLRDFSTFGKLKSFELQEFLDTYFDFVFCLSDLDGLIETYILSNCKATYRVGMHQEGTEDYLDLMVGQAPAEKYKESLEQMLWLAEAIN
ncbi:DUF6913 domain-containing protein [Sediminitomix flava]|uniref:Uncharacterized protein n=1 Tax=Sediminitomix flava TaxID=379075 RepID=A0A315Z4Y7_SEDFL|nr:hypothetical protein [Sediminitomix flava]PWJ38482.1 hypothetical protein BC781_10772 [Sediminitomix flava]